MEDMVKEIMEHSFIDWFEDLDELLGDIDDIDDTQAWSERRSFE